MIAREYINLDIPSLKPSDTLDYAVSLMEDYKIEHLPVVSGENKIVGIIDENIVLDHSNFDLQLDQVILKAKGVAVEFNQHIYETLRFAVEYNTSVVPISKQDGTYLGAIKTTDLINTLADFNSITSKGAIVVLDIKNTDYSLSEIARISEDSNVSILGSGISSNPSDSSRIYLTLKFDQEIVRNVIASFERYDYNILASFQKNTVDDDQDRLNHLFKYLDI